MIFEQQNALSCGGNVCIYCGKCRDWIDDNDINCNNNHVPIFAKRRWYRSPDAKCFFGDHHFLSYYHHRDGNSTQLHQLLKNHDPVPEFFDDMERHFYAHFYNVCKCV